MVFNQQARGIVTPAAPDGPYSETRGMICHETGSMSSFFSSLEDKFGVLPSPDNESNHGPCSATRHWGLTAVLSARKCGRSGGYVLCPRSQPPSMGASDKCEGTMVLLSVPRADVPSEVGSSIGAGSSPQTSCH